MLCAGYGRIGLQKSVVPCGLSQPPKKVAKRHFSLAHGQNPLRTSWDGSQPTCCIAYIFCLVSPTICLFYSGARLDMV